MRGYEDSENLPVNAAAPVFTEAGGQRFLLGQIQPPLVGQQLENSLDAAAAEISVHLHHIPAALRDHAGKIVALLQNFPVDAVVVLEL